MFTQLSAIKNNILTTTMLIQYAMSHVVTTCSSWDIHRIMVYTDRVEITLVDKESIVSYFKDVTFSFSDSRIVTSEGTLYLTDKYFRR